MRSVETAEAEANVGLVGDRYHGTRHRHVTVQSAEELAEADALHHGPIRPEDTRRNITISSGRVPVVPGDRMSLGEIEVEVVRIAAPCELMDVLIGSVSELERGCWQLRQWIVEQLQEAQ